VRRLILASSAALPLALVFAAAAAAGNGGFAPQPPASPNASRITDTYWFVFAFAAFVAVLVEGALIVFIVKYRRGRRRRDAEGPQIHGSTRLEILWTAIPVLILAVIGAFVLYQLPGIKDVPSASAGNQLTVQVRAQQFYWQFTYPNGQISIDRMVVPENAVVQLVVTSADVAHSWWIPALGGKIDAIPGRTNHTWFQGTKLGSYTGQCAELCGIQHAAMKAVVDVVPQAQYRAFLGQHAPSNTPVVGKEIFDGVCAKCHGMSGEGSIGPPLAGNATVAQPDQLEDLLRNGKGNMPAVGKYWGDDQMKAATTYLKERFGGSQG